LNGTAKGLSDVARLLHRDDLANLQYGLKKLLSLGFIEKASDGASRRNTTYVASETGRELVEAYLRHRRDTLVRLVASMSGTQEALQQATSILHVMTGLYDQASTMLTSQLGDGTGSRS
jgi:predicted MarR family transcription regulator